MSSESHKNDATKRFIDRYGMALEEDGMPRTAGRMLALMIVAGRPFSFSELAECLEISRGNVSMNTRFLERLGVIERLLRSGDRQDHFQIIRNPGLRTIEAWLEREAKKERIAEDFLADESLPTDARRRVNELLAFTREITDNARDMIDRLRDE